PEGALPKSRRGNRVPRLAHQVPRFGYQGPQLGNQGPRFESQAQRLANQGLRPGCSESRLWRRELQLLRASPLSLPLSSPLLPVAWQSRRSARSTPFQSVRALMRITRWRGFNAKVVPTAEREFWKV